MSCAARSSPSLKLVASNEDATCPLGLCGVTRPTPQLTPLRAYSTQRCSASAGNDESAELALGGLMRTDRVAATRTDDDRVGNDGGASVEVSRSALAEGAHGSSDRHQLSSPSEAGSAGVARWRKARPPRSAALFVDSHVGSRRNALSRVKWSASRCCSCLRSGGNVAASASACHLS
jgi:hypothetical protein